MNSPFSKETRKCLRAGAVSLIPLAQGAVVGMSTYFSREVIC